MQMRLVPTAIVAAVAALPLSSPVSALQFEAEPPPAGAKRAPGYLSKGAIDFHRYMAPLPPPNSRRTIEDKRMVLLMQRAPAARWRRAQDDSRLLYPRFAEAFGRRIDRASTPALVNLLNRAMRDVHAAYGPAKRFFDRKRPYQVLRLKRVCGFKAPPALGATRKATASHPSGHSSFGWSTAIILSLVAPHRTRDLVARAEDYAWSRVVCAVHFPSDVQSGHVIATAVVTRLRADPEFLRDLACARKEYSAGRPLSCYTVP